MLENYLKTAIRNLRRHKVYTLINVAGLGVGMALCLLIFLFVEDELTFDAYHEHADRIHRIGLHMEGSTIANGIAKVSEGWGPAAVEELPEVEDQTRFVFVGRSLVQRGEVSQYETGGLFADSTTFRIFSWPLIEGNPETALAGPNRMIVTRSFAHRWFSDESLVGQTLGFDGGSQMTVTGLMEDIPSNSHFTFDFLVSLETYSHPNRREGDFVRWNQFYTYLLLAPGVEPDVVERKFDVILDRNLEADNAETFYPVVQPVRSIHLHSDMHREMAANSDIAYVYVFSALAVFILLIAGTNFVTLATARSTQRAQEVGIRKASGADRAALVRQFLGESVLLSLIAVVFAWLLAHWALGPFNGLSGKSYTAAALQQPGLLLGLVAAGGLVGLLAGLYPAAVLSSFRPAAVLKGDLATSGRGSLRRVLVVGQFAISSFLIICTGVVYNQLDYIKNKNLGFSKDQVVIVSTNLPQTQARFETVKGQLLEHPAILKASFSSNQPGGSDWGLPIEIEGRDPSSDDGFHGFRVLNVDWDFLDTYQIEMAEGRGFSREYPGDTTTWIINQTAADQLGWTLETARRIGAPRVSRPFAEVIGIVDDFHFRSMHEEIAPLLIMMKPQWLNTFNLKLAAGENEEALAHVESVMARWEPRFPLTYQFFDEQFESLHEAEQRVSSLLTYFAILAIFIACLGLFGLASFTAEQRTKEIGVRKVLGANVSSIVASLSTDIVRLVLMAIVIAAPAAWFAMNRWLDGFAYGASIGWPVFVIAALVTLSIALATVSYQSIRAALLDPVKALRYE